MKKFLALILSTLTCQQALAALPTVPALNANQGDWFSVIEQIFGKGFDTAALVISGVAFVIVAFTLIGKFRESSAKGEWGEFGVLSCVAAGLLFAVAYFVNQAASTI